MTQQNTVRRHDQPIQIGPRHGYRIEGDRVSINAELQVPPHHSGGEWTLELWAMEQPYREGALTGHKIADIAVALPTPIAPYVHQVDVSTTARLPLHGRAYAMVLAMVRRGADGQTSVDAFANYAEPQTFIAPHFAGEVRHRVEGQEVVLAADAVANPRLEGNLSGTLSIELWAFPESASSSPEGLRLAASEIGCISGQYRLPAIEQRAAFSAPPVGRYRLALLLCEWTEADGYVARDRREVAAIYQRSAPEPVVSPPAPAPTAAAAPARPVEALRLVSSPATAPGPAASAPAAVIVPAAATAAVAAAVPAVAKASPSAASGLVSIQTASVDELAGVQGLNLKIAKEIVKARPFTSLADLTRVRGIGDKTVERLKGLLTV